MPKEKFLRQISGLQKKKPPSLPGGFVRSHRHAAGCYDQFISELSSNSRANRLFQIAHDWDDEAGRGGNVPYLSP
jgi:hypothetical protein